MATIGCDALSSRHAKKLKVLRTRHSVGSVYEDFQRFLYDRVPVLCILIKVLVLCFGLEPLNTSISEEPDSLADHSSFQRTGPVLGFRHLILCSVFTNIMRAVYCFITDIVCLHDGRV